CEISPDVRSDETRDGKRGCAPTHTVYRIRFSNYAETVQTLKIETLKMRLTLAMTKRSIWLMTLAPIWFSFVFAPRAVRADVVYVTNLGNNSDSVEKFNSLGSGSLFATGINGWALACDSGGNLYGSSGSTIMKITPGGSASPFATLGVGFAAGMAFDPQ